MLPSLVTRRSLAGRRDPRDRRPQGDGASTCRVILLSPSSTDAVHRSWTTEAATYPPPVRTAGGDEGERGSTLPFVLLCWLLAALMVFGAIAASDAFLEQRQVQSICDGAALAAADRTDEGV